MNTFYAFSVDDLALGANEVMVSIGRRRFLLRNLSHQVISALARAHKSGSINSLDVPPELFSAMVEKGIVHPLSTTKNCPLRKTPWNTIPSRLVKSICQVLLPIATTKGLAILLALSLLGLITGVCRPHYPAAITTWISTCTLPDALITSTLFFFCIIVHELGHGAACLQRTGIVGSITARLYATVPVLVTDVSSIGNTSRRNKAEIAIAGVIFQSAISVGLLMTPNATVQMAATLSLMSAAFALTPLPGTDGYWFISDCFGARLVGCFGENGRSDWVGRGYTAFLITITTFFVIKLTGFGYLLIDYGMKGFAENKFSSSISILIAAYALLAAASFSKRIFLFIKSGEASLTQSQNILTNSVNSPRA